jgi:lipopolysaccharide/colanic/teichoic acid biosynthesis glycosyltransferase
MTHLNRQPDWENLIPGRWYARRGHRWLDWVLLCLLLPPALPLMLAVGLTNLIVLRNPREVLFFQDRVGWRGVTFRIIKFRTMKEAPGSNHGSWANGEDQLRVTRFGRFLRNTHLDELPQLFNILLGQMSFIGPRPEMVEIESWANEAVPGFSSRLVIRPGVAGLAQITQGYTGRDLEAYTRKLEINLKYLEQLSFALDLSIFVRTIHWMVCGKGWQWNSPPGAINSGQPRSAAAPEPRPLERKAGRSGSLLDEERSGLGTRVGSPWQRPDAIGLFLGNGQDGMAQGKVPAPGDAEFCPKGPKKALIQPMGRFPRQVGALPGSECGPARLRGLAR